MLDYKISKNYLKKKQGKISSDQMDQNIIEAIQELKAALSKDDIIRNLDDLEKEYDIHIKGQQLMFTKLNPEERRNLRQKYFEKIKKIDKAFQASDLFDKSNSYELILACYRKRFEDA